jgi:hypothetical protein
MSEAPGMSEQCDWIRKRREYAHELVFTCIPDSIATHVNVELFHIKLRWLTCYPM